MFMKKCDLTLVTSVDIHLVKKDTSKNIYRLSTKKSNPSSANYAIIDARYPITYKTTYSTNIQEKDHMLVINVGKGSSKLVGWQHIRKRSMGCHFVRILVTNVNMPQIRRNDYKSISFRNMLKLKSYSGKELNLIIF